MRRDLVIKSFCASAIDWSRLAQAVVPARRLRRLESLRFKKCRFKGTSRCRAIASVRELACCNGASQAAADVQVAARQRGHACRRGGCADGASQATPSPYTGVSRGRPRAVNRHRTSSSSTSSSNRRHVSGFHCGRSRRNIVLFMHRSRNHVFRKLTYKIAPTTTSITDLASLYRYSPPQPSSCHQTAKTFITKRLCLSIHQSASASLTSFTSAATIQIY